MQHSSSQIKVRALVLLVFVIPFLFSCGGGGGNPPGNNNTSSNNPVQVNNNPSAPVVPIDPSTLNFTAYYRPSEFVRVDYPASWIVTRSGDVPEALAIFRVSNADTDTNGFIFLIKADVNDLEEDGSVNIISSREISIDGIEGLEEIGDAQVNGLNIRTISTAFEFDGFVYSLAYSNTTGFFERSIEVYRHMVSTFKVGQILMESFDSDSSFNTPGKPGLASDGTDFLYVSCEQRDINIDDFDVVGRIIFSDRSIGTPFTVHSNIDGSNGFCLYTAPQVIYDGVNYLVTYTVTSNNPKNPVFGKRISRSGNIIDAVPINISQNSTRSVYNPSVAFDGDRTLVVWHEEIQNGVNEVINGAFVDRNGSVTPPFTISNNLDVDYPSATFLAEFIPQVTFGNNRYLVVWGPDISSISNTAVFDHSIYGQIIDLNGIPQLPARFPIHVDTGISTLYLQADSNGTEYMVGWMEGPESGSNGLQIYAKRVSVSGTLINTTANSTGALIAGSLLDASSGQQSPKRYLDLSYADGKYLFLWTVMDTGKRGIYGISANNLLTQISAQRPIIGAQENVDRHLDTLKLLTQPNVVRSNDLSIVAWPSRAGWVEGWFFEGDIAR